MHLICEVQVISGLITNCNHKLSSRWSHINAAASGCGAKQVFQRQNETEMDGLDVGRRQGADKGGNLKRARLYMVTTRIKEAWEAIPSEMVKKSFLKTAKSNNMDGTEDDHMWQDSGASSSSEEEPNKTRTQMSV